MVQLKIVRAAPWPHCPNKMSSVTAWTGRMTAHIVWDWAADCSRLVVLQWQRSCVHLRLTASIQMSAVVWYGRRRQADSRRPGNTRLCFCDRKTVFTSWLYDVVTANWSRLMFLSLVLIVCLFLMFILVVWIVVPVEAIGREDAVNESCTELWKLLHANVFWLFYANMLFINCKPSLSESTTATV